MGKLKAREALERVCWLLAGGYLIAFGYLLGVYGR